MDLLPIAMVVLMNVVTQDTNVLASPNSHVRTEDRRVYAALAEGIRRSPTFARLVVELNQSDVIVYIQVSDMLRATTVGRMMLGATAPGVRYVRIQVLPNRYSEDLIAILGHELQHAVELARHPHVRTEGALIDLYRRIGAGRSGPLGFETEAAIIAAERVRRDLRRTT